MDNKEAINELLNGDFKIPEEFNIDFQFAHYMQLVKVDIRKMHPNQLREMRRCFYGAWGIQMVMNSHVLIEKYTEDQAAVILDKMFRQVSDFWNKEIAKDSFPQN